MEVDDLFPCEKAVLNIQVWAILLTFFALVPSAVCGAQVCPIKIEEVSQYALTSEMGTYGYAIKVTYRNVSHFPYAESNSASSPKRGSQSIQGQRDYCKPQIGPGCGG